ncbi:growth hormone receptor-like [Anguilla rostrata]|uniref:growth hormone receptor-like n=1 Tax=Anguilla rostrata TaxID=7938 RepID=UPI0030D413CC
MAIVLLLVLALVTGVGSLASTAPPTTSQAPPGGPHFTSCVSREMETFRCWWTAGNFLNLSEPGALRVFFLKNGSPKVWQECPQYSWSVESECFFNKTHTSIWTTYCLQLVSKDRGVTYDNTCLSVENIVHPDPPVGLNWTLLNVSQSALHFDAVIHWKPPSSADVEKGWMTLVYEVQYREKTSPHWNTLDWEKSSSHSLYGLRVNTEYEARVRCKMLSFVNAGEFSEPIFISLPRIHTKESRIPVVVLLIFGTVGVGALLLLIIYSQQQRLMVIFLPPVPAPKIKGIDSELLKKGKFDQLSSILNSHHMYKPDVALEDPWVEHIELDFDEMGEREEHWDTQSLLQPAPPTPYDPSLRDDDSGRASCCDPDLPDPDTPLPSPALSAPRLLSPPRAGRDFYTQVGEVTQAGVVVLASGTGPTKEEEEEELKKKKMFQLVVGTPAGGGYTSEDDARRFSGNPAPTLDYTLVKDVGDQRSLLLNLAPPDPAHTKPLPLACSAQVGPAPTKPLPLPAGYLTPDLLASMSP